MIKVRFGHLHVMHDAILTFSTYPLIRELALKTPPEKMTNQLLVQIVKPSFDQSGKLDDTDYMACCRRVSLGAVLPAQGVDGLVVYFSLVDDVMNRKLS